MSSSGRTNRRSAPKSGTSYADLKKYQPAPSAEKKAELDRRFDEIFTPKTRFETLHQVLQRLHRNKSELLLVLERPEVPLHTNDSERDIRDYVKIRKVSGGDRRDPWGRGRGPLPRPQKN